MVHMAKPAWVSHDGQPIFSVDVHPDGTRFATAGQDHAIKIWALAPVLDEASEQDDSVPRLLATLSGHEGAVNCARWSPDGRFLASGSDDSMVMLWRLAGAGERLGAVPFGGRAATQHEKWRCARVVPTARPPFASDRCLSRPLLRRSCASLRGHSGDVVGVAWAPDSQRLASVSIDNSVRVWDVTADPARQLVAVLQGHRSMVKGVSWDPIGRYLASQGDDRAVVVWEQRGSMLQVPSCWCHSLLPRPHWAGPPGAWLRCAIGTHRRRPGPTWEAAARPRGPEARPKWPIPRRPPPRRDWTEAARIEAPFKGSTSKTLFRRLAWSPDGQFLCCPHAFKKPVNIAVVLRRPSGTAGDNDWAQECDFVGHNSPVGVVAFNQHIFRRGAGTGTADDAPSKPYCCAAVGGQDCLLSIWLTSRPKPLVVVKDIFEQDVLDLAWTPDGCAA